MYSINGKQEKRRVIKQVTDERWGYDGTGSAIPIRITPTTVDLPPLRIKHRRLRKGPTPLSSSSEIDAPQSFDFRLLDFGGGGGVRERRERGKAFGSVLRLWQLVFRKNELNGL